MRDLLYRRICIAVLTLVLLAAILVMSASCDLHDDPAEEKDLTVELYSVAQSNDLVVDNENKTATFTVSDDSGKFGL